MLKNITLSADERLIRRARERARREHRSLNEAFRAWLGQFARSETPAARYEAVMERLDHVRTGRKFSRDEMNER